MASNKFINECKNRANANRLGKIIVDDVDTPITNSNSLQSFSIDSGCYVNGNIIGSVYSKCLNANFIADQNNLTDKTIQANIGVKYADLTEEYISLGKYKVERPNNEITANMSQITAYDDLYTNLENKYVCNIDYSNGNKTVADLYIDVCNQLDLIPKTTEFMNSNILITNNPFTNGEKNRTVLQTIAKISCSFIDIDNDTNEIDLCWLSQNEEPDYIFYKNDYVSVEGGQVVCGPINCLIIKNSVVDDENVTIKDNDSISLYGEHSVVISEDYILHNVDLRGQAINNIWNRVKGMKYVDCKLTTYYGKPFLKLGDKIRIYTSETEYFDTYVLKHSFTYDGSFTSVIESPALTEQEIKTKQDVSLAEKLRNTQIDIDKQNAKIRAEVKEAQENSVDKDDIVASLNLAIENGQGIIKFISNQFLVEADNLKIDQYGSVQMSNAEIVGGNIELFDDGTRDGSSIKIHTKIDYGTPITIGTDLSNKKLLFNFDSNTVLPTDIESGKFYTLLKSDNFQIQLYMSEQTTPIKMKSYFVYYNYFDSTSRNRIVVIRHLDDEGPNNVTKIIDDLQLNETAGVVTYIADYSLNSEIVITDQIDKVTNISGYGIDTTIAPRFNYDREDMAYILEKLENGGTFSKHDIFKYDLNLDGAIDMDDYYNVQWFVLNDITVENPGRLKINTQNAKDNFVLTDGYGTDRVAIDFSGIKFKGNTHLSIENGLGEEVISVGAAGIYIDQNLMSDLCQNKILWEAQNSAGGYYMTSDHIAYLSEKVSEQAHGIILVWWAFNPSSQSLVGGPVAQQVIPKCLISDDAMTFHQDMHYANFTYSGTKVVYITDSSISGNNGNTATGTGNSGIKYNNNRFVLSYVIGF